ALAATVAEAEGLIAPTEATIRERLGQLVFGVEDEDLQHAVLDLLAKRRLTFAGAGSLTAGFGGDRLAVGPGASAVFMGRVIAHDNRVKRDLLGVPQQLLDEKGAVCAEVAEAMAVGCRNCLQTDLAVSTTGVAGPDPLGPDKPAGLVYVGIAWDGG